jgi:hypothetical protein
MLGSRFVSVALLILLLAGLVGGALITRYRYYDTQGVLFHRIDRWTGRVQQWDNCPQKIPIPSDFDTVVSKRFDILEGADSGQDAPAVEALEWRRSEISRD